MSITLSVGSLGSYHSRVKVLSTAQSTAHSECYSLLRSTEHDIQRRCSVEPNPAVALPA